MPVLDPQYYQNHIKRSISGKYQPHGEPTKADCVFAAGFGYRLHDGQVLPSMTTRQIAHALHDFEHLPKIVSHDVAATYRKLFAHNPDTLHELDLPAEHLTNIRLVNMLRDYLKHLSLKQPMLIAHQHHVSWLDYLCGQIHINTIVPSGLQFAFDPVSAQSWTRDEAAWRQEISGRLAQGYAEGYQSETLRFHHGNA